MIREEIKDKYREKFEKLTGKKVLPEMDVFSIVSYMNFFRDELINKELLIDEVIKEILENRIVCKRDFIFIDDCIQIIKDKLKEK